MLAMKYIEIKKYTYKITSTILFLYENNFKYIKILNVTDNVNRENFNKKYVAGKEVGISRVISIIPIMISPAKK
jgi:hypothetical protein